MGLGLVLGCGVTISGGVTYYDGCPCTVKYPLEYHRAIAVELITCAMGATTRAWLACPKGIISCAIACHVTLLIGIYLQVFGC